ncbi:MAG: WG repeat-containing protein [Candidatus Obscuribacterales bacterium]|nr:WG repeat-containing protein [Candidatus Obscuribacterales bacterium]
MSKPHIRAFFRLSCAIALVLIGVSVHAEGLPLSGNHLTCKKLTITLTKPQLQQAKTRKPISLTPAQSALFLKQVKYVPKKLNVMPLSSARQADSCFLEDVGILINANTVEVPEFLLGKYNEDRQPHVREEQVHSWGFIDTSGKEAIPLQFRDASDFHDGIATVDVSTSHLLFKDDKRFIDKKGNFLPPSAVPPKLSINKRFPMAWEFHEGLAIFKDTATNKYGFVDESGKVAVPATFDDAYIIESGFFEGLSPVKKDGKWGYVNRSGSFVIPPKFLDARQFHDGLAAVKLSGEELQNKKRSTPTSNWTFIDRSGTTWSKTFVAVHDFAEGLTAAEVREPKSSFNSPAEIEDMPNLPLYKQIYKANGELLTQTIFDDVGKSSEGMIPIRHGKLVGFLNSQGKTIVEPKFLAVDSFSEGLAAIAEQTPSGTKLGFIDKAGNNAIPARFPLSYIDFKMWLLGGHSRFHDGLSLIQVDSKYGYLKRSGDWLVEPRFDQAKPFSDGLAAVCQYGRHDARLPAKQPGQPK